MKQYSEAPMAGVYAIRNKHTGQIYVGSSFDIAKRWRGHLSKFKSGFHQKRMQGDWLTYGADAFTFEILEETTDIRAELRIAEQKWVDRLLAGYPNRLYNIDPRVRRIDVPSEIDPNHINRVREFRVRKSFTQYRLAVLCGTSQQVIHHLEMRGQRRPWSFDLEKLATALGTTVDDLFPEEAA